MIWQNVEVMENIFSQNNSTTQTQVGAPKEPSQRNKDRDAFVAFLQDNTDTFNSAIGIISDAIEGSAPGSIIAYTATFGTSREIAIVEFKTATNIVLAQTGMLPVAFKSLDALIKHVSKQYGIVVPTEKDMLTAGTLIQAIADNGSASLADVAKILAKLRLGK
jgi:hypothetical protein